MTSPRFHVFRKSFLRSPFGGAGVSALLAPRKPRHPLLRLAFGLLGLALLAVLVVVGVFVGAAMLIGGLMLRLIRPTPRAAASRPAAMEAEYRVIRRSTSDSVHILR